MSSTTEKTSENPIATSDNDNDELTRLRVEAAAARKQVETSIKELYALKLDKATTIARNEFNREWRERGYSQDDALRKLYFRTLVRVNEDDYEVNILNFDGTESIGANIPQLLDRIAATIPGVKPPKLEGEDDESASGGGSSTPATPNGVPGLHTRKAKDDFTRAQKVAYIERYGLAAWERIPTSNKPRNTGGGATREADFARNWSNTKKVDYMKEHGVLALSQLMAKEREENR